MIPYVEHFLTKHYADGLLEFLRQMPFVRQKNPRNDSYLRRMSYNGWSPLPTNHGDDRASGYGKMSPDAMPEEVKPLREALSEYAGKDVNYFGVIGYNGGDDHIAWHQHAEDKSRDEYMRSIGLSGDQTVWVVSLGFPRLVSLRPNGSKDRSTWEQFRAAHGSLYVLPHEFNMTHDHAILDEKEVTGFRISLNCKHIEPEYVTHVLEELAAKRKTEKPLKEVVIYTNGRQSIYCCRKGCKWPPDAVYVGCKCKQWPDTPFGNHEDTKEAFVREAKELMRSPEFRAQLETLRGKDLLCWCSPADDCHAKTWLELANAPGGAENGK